MQNYVASICMIHELSGYGTIVKGIFYKKTIAGIRRKLRHQETHAKPISFEMLHDMLKQVNFHDDQELVSWTTIIYAFHLFLRKSDLVPDTRTLDDEKQFQRKDFRTHKDVMLVYIKWAKNRQCGESKLLILVVRNSESELYWFHYIVTRISAPPHAPAFVYRKKQKLVPLTYQEVQADMRK